MAKPGPVAIQIAQTPEQTTFLTARDFSDFKILGLVFVLAASWKLVEWLFGVIWTAVKGKSVKIEDKIEMLTEAVLRLEEAVKYQNRHQEKLEKEIIPRHELHSIIRTELDYHTKSFK